MPSLPAYTSSSTPPVDIDFRIEDVTRLFNKIAPSLGFGKDYIVQRGDLGSKVARVMAAEHAACNAAHINFCIMPEPSQPIGTIDELETRGLESAAAFSKTGSTYALEHATPLSMIAFVHASSLVTLLWIGENSWAGQMKTHQLTLSSSPSHSTE
jgi:microsomal epoxide hydrolase